MYLVSRQEVLHHIHLTHLVAMCIVIKGHGEECLLDATASLYLLRKK